MDEVVIFFGKFCFDPKPDKNVKINADQKREWGQGGKQNVYRGPGFSPFKKNHLLTVKFKLFDILLFVFIPDKRRECNLVFFG
mgnify:FL=1